MSLLFPQCANLPSHWTDCGGRTMNWKVALRLMIALQSVFCNFWVNYHGLDFSSELHDLINLHFHNIQVEQLHKIFKLCGSPSEEYWIKSRLPHATIFKPQQSYRRCIAETFKDFPPSSLPLIETLLAIDPAERQTATTALQSAVSCSYPFCYFIT